MDSVMNDKRARGELFSTSSNG